MARKVDKHGNDVLIDFMDGSEFVPVTQARDLWARMTETFLEADLTGEPVRKSRVSYKQPRPNKAEYKQRLFCLLVLRRAAQRELRLGLSARPVPLGCGSAHVPNHAGGMSFATTCVTNAQGHGA